MFYKNKDYNEDDDHHDEWGQFIMIDNANSLTIICLKNNNHNNHNNRNKRQQPFFKQPFFKQPFTDLKPVFKETFYSLRLLCLYLCFFILVFFYF